LSFLYFKSSFPPKGRKFIAKEKSSKQKQKVQSKGRKFIAKAESSKQRKKVHSKRKFRAKQ
jgi:hypothetical protein